MSKKQVRKLCSTINCIKQARGGYDKCVSCGGGNKCSTIGCTSSAVTKYDKCKKHYGGKRCAVDECENSAEGGYEMCKRHKGGKRCAINGCENSAQGGYETCKRHGGGERCPNCVDWIDSRSGNKKYDGYCATCFKRVFPNDPRSKVIYEHTKEIMVRNAINKNFEGFVHDTPIYTHGCECTHRRRIDHRRLINETILAIETDERAHQGYDKVDEEIRYDDVYMVHGGKWIFIRFNPDNTHINKVDIEDRISVLLETIRTQIERIENGENTELMEIVKLFY